MQTIQFKVDDNYLTLKTDEQMKLDRVKGILKNRIADPMEYQRNLRDEWERK